MRISSADIPEFIRDLRPSIEGTLNVGTVDFPFKDGRFKNMHSDYYYGDARYLKNVPFPICGYVHTQTEESVVWIVDHNLGTDDLIVQTRDNSVPPVVIYPANIEFTTPNKISITFEESQSGEARMIVVPRTPSSGGAGINSAGIDLQQEGIGSGNTEINWDSGAKFKLELGDQDETLSFVSTEKGTFTLIIKQDSVGERKVIWPDSVKWSNGEEPTLSTSANSVDIITFYFDGENYYGKASLDFS